MQHQSRPGKTHTAHHLLIRDLPAYIKTFKNPDQAPIDSSFNYVPNPIFLLSHKQDAQLLEICLHFVKLSHLGTFLHAILYQPL